LKGSIKKNKVTGKFDFVFDSGVNPLTGKRMQIRRRGFETRRKAHDEMVKMKSEVISNNFIDFSSITYAKYMEEWFEERKIKLQKNTYEIHWLFYHRIIKPKLGHLKLQKLSSIHLQHFINDLVKESSYSPNTIHLIFRIISSSLKKAEILNLIKVNPSSSLTLPKVISREMNVWTLEEVNKFIFGAKRIKRLTRCHIGFLLALLTGMRQGEILGLRWKDIDFDNQVIYIRQTLTQDAKIKNGAKNHSSIRSIHVSEKLLCELHLHRNIIDNEKIVSNVYVDNDLVLCTQNGNPIIPRNFRKEFYKLSDKLHLPKIRFHDLRHTHATLLIQQNVNVKLISERLGHANISTTLDTYSHVLPNMQKSVTEELEKIINM
jgi:integrase